MLHTSALILNHTAMIRDLVDGHRILLGRLLVFLKDR